MNLRFEIKHLLRSKHLSYDSDINQYRYMQLLSPKTAVNVSRTPRVIPVYLTLRFYYQRKNPIMILSDIILVGQFHQTSSLLPFCRVGPGAVCNQLQWTDAHREASVHCWALPSAPSGSLKNGPNFCPEDLQCWHLRRNPSQTNGGHKVWWTSNSRLMFAGLPVGNAFYRAYVWFVPCLCSAID